MKILLILVMLVFDLPLYGQVDSVKITHYYNGDKPPVGTEGKLIAWYDGCNVNTVVGGIVMSTLIYCEFLDGSVIKIWHKYQISKNEFIVIHSKRIYNNPNIKRW